MGFNYKWNKEHIYCGFLLIIVIIILFSLGSMFLTNAQEDESINSTINQTNITLPYIDPEILKAFKNNQTWVSVFIIPVDNSNITVTGNNEERWNLSRQRDEWFRLAEETIISDLSNTDIQNVRKHIGSFDAEISREGLNNLANDKRIEKVILNYGGSPSIAINQNQSVSENASIFENETTSKENKIEEKKSYPPKLWMIVGGTIAIFIILTLIIYLLILRRQKKE